MWNLKSNATGASLAVQWLRLPASTAGATGSTPGWGTKIPHAAWYGKKNQPPPKNANELYIV